VGWPIPQHRARELRAIDVAADDLVLAADRANPRALARLELATTPLLLGSFDPTSRPGDKEIPPTPGSAMTTHSTRRSPASNAPARAGRLPQREGATEDVLKSQRVVEILGPVRWLGSLGGSVWLLDADGERLVAQCSPGVSEEARGLCAIAAVPNAPLVPDVIAHQGDPLLLRYVLPGPRDPRHDEELGSRLAHLHAAPWPRFGGGSSRIGNCRVDPDPAGATATASGFYAARVGKLARQAELASDLEAPLPRLHDLLDGVPASLCHGDLWWGNVINAADGRGWLIDPSHHGGVAEENLGMLALFGPVPERLLRAYHEVHPLDEDWRARAELLQVVPLLVHTILFTAHYREAL